MLLERFLTLREALIQAPVLRYFDSSKPVTLSMDAIQLGVGAVLMQDAQPVAFSSRTLTEAQTIYAQIEKETLAIVHGCTKFQDYIFGQHAVTVESDHRPLVAIFSKPLYVYSKLTTFTTLAPCFTTLPHPGDLQTEQRTIPS